MNKLPGELGGIVEPVAAYGHDPVATLQRGLTFRRFTTADIRPILDAGTGVADVVDEGPQVDHGLPTVPGPGPVRLRDRGVVLMAATRRVLPADLEHGLKRLKLRAIRQLAPEVLITAQTQRWAPRSCFAP